MMRLAQQIDHKLKSFEANAFVIFRLKFDGQYNGGRLFPAQQPSEIAGTR